MSFASEDLRREHEGILFGMDILEAMVDLIAKEKEFDIEDAKSMVEFFKLFADKCHHGKEEGLLFPAMEKAGIIKDGGPIGQMLLEHTMGRKYISLMAESTDNGALMRDNFIKTSKDYIQLLRSHIQKENTVLFPLGDRMIPLDEQAKLLEAFESFEEEVMGKGTHEKLHELLEKFETKYL